MKKIIQLFLAPGIEFFLIAQIQLLAGFEKLSAPAILIAATLNTIFSFKVAEFSWVSSILGGAIGGIAIFSLRGVWIALVSSTPIATLGVETPVLAFLLVLVIGGVLKLLEKKGLLR